MSWGENPLLKETPMKRPAFSAEKTDVPFVIEYTEIPAELAEQRDDAGAFVYGDAHILCNLVSN